jgi:hypothetical protein
MRTNPNYVRPLPRRVQCRADGCDVTLVFLRNPKTGKSIPVDASKVDAQARDFDATKHVSHFRECPGANTFSASRKVKPQADAFEEDAARDMGVPSDVGNK